MATILTRHGKRKTSFVIHFYSNDRKTRYYLCLGQKYRRRQAEEIKILIENLLDAAATKRRLYPEEEEAVRRLPKDLKRRIAVKGLLKGFQFLSVGEIWDRYLDAISNDSNIKKSTVVTYQTASKRFLGYFESEIEPDDIELEDGSNWRDWLEETFNLSEASAASTIVRTRTVFSWAQKNGYCQANIFLDVHKGSTENKENEFYVPMEWFEKTMEVCPDNEWRVYLALMRIGGVRMGEAHALTWENVLWKEDKVRIVSPKTERFQGHDERIIPLFPRLRSELQSLYDAKECKKTGQVLACIHKGRSQRAIDGQLKALIRHAGFPVWSRLNHNLRGSRSNELFSAFPDHVAEYWMGHSKKVAKKHYLHVMSDQYNLALDFEKENKKTDPKQTTEPEPPKSDNSKDDTKK